MVTEYNTIDKISEGEFRDRGSKFLAYAFPSTDEGEAKAKIEALWKEHPNACHICFAWRFGVERFQDRYSDDGEPNNSAGKPIFGQILSFELTNIAIAVVRYYGGTNLGVGGLVTAYKTASKEALSKAKITIKKIQNYYSLCYNYEETGVIMSILNKWNTTIINQGFEHNQPIINFNIPIISGNSIEQELSQLKTTNLTLIKTV